ncbi:hypothetical protein THAOC_21879, partial [Thalassiosira oceanica]
RTSVAARPQWVQGWVASDIPAGDAPYERRVDLPRSLASPAVRGSDRDTSGRLTIGSKLEAGTTSSVRPSLGQGQPASGEGPQGPEKGGQMAEIGLWRGRARRPYSGVQKNRFVRIGLHDVVEGIPVSADKDMAQVRERRLRAALHATEVHAYGGADEGEVYIPCLTSQRSLTFYDTTFLRSASRRRVADIAR